MKKIIPALALLLISAMVLATSSYAWFTMNTTVSATGMQVKAQASGGLMIATYDGSKTGDDRFGSGFKASASALITDVSTLSPVSTVDLSSWYTATAASVDSYAKTTENYKTVTTSASSYYLVNHFAVSTAGGSADTTNELVIDSLAVDVTDSKSAALNKSLRVAVVVTDASNSSNKTTLFFAPGYDSTAADLAYTWTAVKSDNATQTVNGYANIKDSKTVDVFSSIPALSYVDIYVYYEGEDTNCKNTNTVNGVDTLTISVGFKAVKIV